MVKVKISKYMVRNPVDIWERHIQQRLPVDSFLDIISWTISLGGFIHGYMIAQSHVLLGSNGYFNEISNGYDDYFQKFVAVYYLGEAIGALCSFLFMDEFGRRNTLITANLACVFNISWCFMTIVPTHLLYFRLFLGICVGTMINSAAIYLAEVAPSGSRGRSISFLAINMMTGNFMGSLSHLLSRHFEIIHFHMLGWRLSLVIPIVLCIFQAIMLYYLPESPRWLLAKKTPTDCSTALCTLRRSSETTREFSDIYRALSSDARLSDMFVDLLSLPPLRLKLLLTSIIVGVQQVIGIQCVTLFGHHILHIMQFQRIELILIAIPLGGILGGIICYRLVDQYGRRYLLLIGSLLMCFAYFSGGICVQYELQSNQNGPNLDTFVSSQLSSPSDDIITSLSSALNPYYANHIIFISMLTLLSISYFLSWGSIGWIYPAEVFPYRARAKLHAVLTGGRFFIALASATTLSNYLDVPVKNTAGQGTITHFQGNTSSAMIISEQIVQGEVQQVVALSQLQSCFLYLSGLSFLTMIIVYFSLPETRGLMLEDMDELFKLEPNSHNNGGSSLYSSCCYSLFNANYCCFCLSRNTMLGWKIYSRNVRYVSNNATSYPTSDAIYHTPNQPSSHSNSFQHYQYYSSTNHTPTSFQNHTVMNTTEQGIASTASVVSEEDEQVFQIYEPSRLHKYSNEMRENKFSYYHPPNPPSSLVSFSNRINISASNSAKDSDKAQIYDIIQAFEGEEKQGTALYGSLDVSDEEKLYYTPHKAEKVANSEDEAESMEESNLIHFIDAERNFLDSLLGSPRKGKF